MTQINDGGPAFPIPGLQDDESFNGATLRDYFAIHAATVPDDLHEGLAEQLMGNARPKQSSPPRDSYWLETAQWWADAEARYRYMKADTMLRARRAVHG